MMSGVDLVDDGEMVGPLDLVFLVDHHIVPQVVEAQLVVGPVGDIGGVRLPTGVVVQIVDDQPHAQPHIAVDLAHPFAVAAGEVIVDRDDVDPFPGQGVEIGGQGGHQGLAFTGFHFGDPPLVQDDTAEDLDREGAHPEHPVTGLAADGKGVWQDIVGAFSHLQPVPQLVGLGPQFLLAHGAVGLLQPQHLVTKRLDPLDFPFAVISEQRLDQSQCWSPRSLFPGYPLQTQKPICPDFIYHTINPAP